MALRATGGDAAEMEDSAVGTPVSPPGPRRSGVSILRSAVELGAAATAGGFAWFGGDLFRWDRWGPRVEGANPLGIMILMGVAGLVLGAVSRRPGWMVGLATAALPIARIPIDGIADPTSHNLFPIEVAIDLFVSSPAIAVGVLWDLLRGRGPYGTSSRRDDPGDA